jgi:hypothetical protein
VGNSERDHYNQLMNLSSATRALAGGIFETITFAAKGGGVDATYDGRI